MRLSHELQRWQDRVEEIARGYGLDFYRTIFESLSYDELNEVAAFGGFPTRYPHWRWGMQYEQFSKGYEYGLQKIYELVINNDPCYAYLMNSNPVVDQKMVMAHVYGHCDFFKNNDWFAHSDRKMMDTMANHATKIRRLVDEVGHDKVEDFIDLALSVENLIDHMAPFVARRETGRQEDEVGTSHGKPGRSRPYMDQYLNPPGFIVQGEVGNGKQDTPVEDTPAKPVRDILTFLIDHAPLEEWQLEILRIIRSEAHYFNPQSMTKIMNEGWATYWHQKMMTRRLLDDGEILDYAQTMSSAVSGTGDQINPYQLGLALWHDIEERWDRGRHGLDYERCDDYERLEVWDTGAMEGRETIFRARKIHNDCTFIDEFLTEEFCHRHRLFIYGFNPRTQKREIVSRDFDGVRNQLLRQLTNAGHPIIDVVDANHGDRGELCLAHRWETSDLHAGYARETLANIHRLWKRPVVLETCLDGKDVVFRAGEDGVTTEEA